jgi:hypothetical protein
VGGLRREPPGSWGRTAPTACDSQEIVVYAVLAEGAWRYDAREHRLLRVRTGDLRALTGTQDFVSVAPLNLVYVIDHEHLQLEDGLDPEEHGVLAGADIGCIVENIYLYCAGAGLATVVRGSSSAGSSAPRWGCGRTSASPLRSRSDSPGRPNPLNTEFATQKKEGKNETATRPAIHRNGALAGAGRSRARQGGPTRPLRLGGHGLPRHDRTGTQAPEPGRLFSVRIDVTLPGHELAINRVQDEDAYVALRDAFDAARRKVDESMRIRRGEVKQHNAG